MALGYHDDGCYQCRIYGDCLKYFGERTRPPCAKLEEEKLPTMVECERWYVKEKCGFEHITELEKNVIREIHDYISRHLRVGA